MNLIIVGLSDANLSKLELCQEIKKYVPDFYFVKPQSGRSRQAGYIVSNERIERRDSSPMSHFLKGFRN